MPRAVAYLRSSTLGQSIQHQEAAQRWAASAGVDVEIVRDEVVSGSKASRPALDGLLRRCRDGNVRTVWAWELSRLGGSLGAVVRLLEELSTLGVRVVLQSEGIDYQSASGRAFVHMLGVMAQFERDLLRERTVAGLDARRDENGKVTKTDSGMPSGGQAFVWDDATGLEALAWYRAKRAEGWGWRRLAAEGPAVFRRTVIDGRVDAVPARPSAWTIRRALKG